MADKKLTDLTALTGSNLASGDLFYVVDISEPTAADKSKKITYSELATSSNYQFGFGHIFSGKMIRNSFFRDVIGCNLLISNFF